MLSEANRAYLYRIFLALVPIATVYGIVEEAEAALWTGLGAAVLGVGLAVANTSAKSDDRP